MKRTYLTQDEVDEMLLVASGLTKEEWEQQLRESAPARELGWSVAERRTELGWSRGERVERSGLSRQEVQDIEIGSGNPTLRSLQRIGEVLGMSVTLRLDAA